MRTSAKRPAELPVEDIDGDRARERSTARGSSEGGAEGLADSAPVRERVDAIERNIERGHADRNRREDSRSRSPPFNGYVFEGFITVKRNEAIQQIGYRHLTKELTDGVENFFADMGGEPDYDPKHLKEDIASTLPTRRRRTRRL